MSQHEDYFSPDYATAKSRFEHCVKANRGRLEHLSLDALSIDGRPLSIDIAWFGTAKPHTAIVHSSGLHGVEGFAGSAIQLKLIQNLAKLPNHVAVIFVHSLNPYGMSWLRRVNENNVDLNRNYVGVGKLYAGAPSGYAIMNPLINPPSPPALDFFFVKAIYNIAKYGFQSLKQAIAEGQYVFPKGLFYGGNTLEQGLLLYKAWLQRQLGNAQHVLAIDVHTGLGKWARDSLYMDCKQGAMPDLFYGGELAHRVLSDYKESVAYDIKGGLVSLLLDACEQAKVDFILQEFGTYSPLKVLYTLRQENRLHFYSDEHQNLVHPVKQRLKQIFYPQYSDWQGSVLSRGESIVQLAIKHLR